MLYDFIIQKQKKLLSQSTADKHAVSIQEILFLFVFFAFILYLLFPKETLKEKVLKEEKSNDLALVYIENMIKFDYKNYELLLHFADIHLKEDRFSAVKGIVEMLLKSDNKEAQRSAMVLGEKLFKRQYFLLEEQEDKEKLLEEYQDALHDMVLISKDEKFQEDILGYFQAHEDKSEYVKLLEGLSKVNKWGMKLANHYVENNKQEQALELCKEMLSKDMSNEDKKVLLSKTIDVLMFGSFFEEGAQIVQKYEMLFSKDEEIMKKIIQFYLAADQADKAREYILKTNK